MDDELSSSCMNPCFLVKRIYSDGFLRALILFLLESKLVVTCTVDLLLNEQWFNIYALATNKYHLTPVDSDYFSFNA